MAPKKTVWGLYKGSSEKGHQMAMEELAADERVMGSAENLDQGNADNVPKKEEQ